MIVPDRAQLIVGISKEHGDKATVSVLADEESDRESHTRIERRREPHPTFCAKREDV